MNLRLSTLGMEMSTSSATLQRLHTPTRGSSSNNIVSFSHIDATPLHRNLKSSTRFTNILPITNYFSTAKRPHSLIGTLRCTLPISAVHPPDCTSKTLPKMPSAAEGEISDTGRCLLCVPVTSLTVAGMTSEMAEAARQGCDVIEIRLDLLEGASSGCTLEQQKRDLESLLSQRPQSPKRLPLIVTCRAAWEGGNYGCTEEQRLQLLCYAVELGVEFVDIELKAASRFFSEYTTPNSNSKSADVSTDTEGQRTRFIVSHHRFDAATEEVNAEELKRIINSMEAVGADIAKMALMPGDIKDNTAAFKALSQSQIPTIALLMGEKGLISRILAPKYNAFLTFAALSAGRESAPGQPAVADILKKYNFRGVHSGTKVYGVIGKPVGHSRSPVLHNAAFRQCNVDAVYVPLLVDDLRSFLHSFDSPDFAGFSVTIPHKLTALECCDQVEPLAKSIGAVNTLIRSSDGTLKGYNTDCEAAILAIEAGLRGSGTQDAPGEMSPLRGRVVVVIGAGGAGRALAFGAKDRGARVVIANRSLAKAEDLAESVGGVAMPLDLLQHSDESALSQFLKEQQMIAQEERGAVEGTPEECLGVVLANTTSVGMHPNEDESPASETAVAQFCLVFDAVYTPLRTKLLSSAEASGATTVSGLEMFVGQAARQFELFTGQEAPVALMRQVVLDTL